MYVRTRVHACMYVYFSYQMGLSRTWTWSLFMPGVIISAMQHHSMATRSFGLLSQWNQCYSAATYEIYSGLLSHHP